MATVIAPVVGPFQATGNNPLAKFSLKIHRGEGMCLLAMDWTAAARPPDDFVGFAIEYREPGGDRYYALQNRLTFVGADPKDPRLKSDPDIMSSLRSPFQKFRWVHFPRYANKRGLFDYRVTPVFMNSTGGLNLGEAQTASIELARETFPSELNVAFTRGYVSSQAFVDRFGAKSIPKLLPAKADQGLKFKPTDPNKSEALPWMGFEASEIILKLLDDAIADTGDVLVVAYDLNLPYIVDRLKKLGSRLKIIIDNGDRHHKQASSAENEAERILVDGGAQVKRQHMKYLQHNKFIVVNGNTKSVVCGSTNFSWRGFYVQANNAVLLRGSDAVALFTQAFNRYWTGTAATFSNTTSADWQTVPLPSVRPDVTFSPHSVAKVKMEKIIEAIKGTNSTLLYSLAFLYLTVRRSKKRKVVPEAKNLVAAINSVVSDPKKFVYGMSDHKVGGLDVRKPNGNLAAVSPGALKGKVPTPFKTEVTGGSGTRLHHKFVVIDFNTPNARVYLGSYNFSKNADDSNGENLLRIDDPRVATSYMIEALRLFDAYHFRANVEALRKKGTPLKQLCLKKPPKKGQKPWFDEYYSDRQKMMDRTLFA